MAEFLCVLKQKGEGCDYSIACGTSVYAFEADDWNVAFQKVKEYYDWVEFEDDDYTLEDLINRFEECEFALESCVIYAVDSKMETLYETWLDNTNRKKMGIDDQKEKEARRVEYEKLKAEFGD